MPRGRAKQPKSVEALTHEEARRRNTPSAEHQPLMREKEQSPIRLSYERRNRDLDPQLVWRGKDEQDWSDLVVNTPPLYIQERVHPKVLVDDLMRQSANGSRPDEYQTDMFADFNGLPSEEAKAEFYQHDANWSNRMILGDSLQVMASLAEREGLRGKVQCIYVDPPYGIRFNSNFQWSTTSRDVRDGNAAHITREPEQVKAFRDTWRDGIHSYLTYLRDRLTVARDLLSESGSIFMQIGDENVHRVRALMDEVFGEQNLIALIPFKKTGGKGSSFVDVVNDYICWYGKSKTSTKFRKLYRQRPASMIATGYNWIEEDNGTCRRLTTAERQAVEAFRDKRILQSSILVSQSGGEKTSFPVEFEGSVYKPSRNTFWKTNERGMETLRSAGRLMGVSGTLAYKRYERDFPVVQITALWEDTIESTLEVVSFV